MIADPAGVGSNTPAFAPGMVAHMQAMQRFKDPDQGVQSAPNIISRFECDEDPSGAIATFQPGGATFPANNAFFQNLGSNGRTCFTCHQPQSGWTVSAADIADRFAASRGTDPIFRLVDGATCPSADVSSLAAKRRAYTLLIEKGLIWPAQRAAVHGPRSGPRADLRQLRRHRQAEGPGSSRARRARSVLS